MAPADIEKWISGETEAFFDPFRTPPFDTATGGAGNERSSARLFVGKFARPTIAVAVGVCASIAMVCFVIPMRHSVEPSPAAYAKSEPNDGETGSARAGVLEVDSQYMPATPSKEIIPTLTRQTTEPSPAAYPKSERTDGETGSVRARALEVDSQYTLATPSKEIIPTLIGPTIEPSDARLAAFLREVGIWYDRRVQAISRPVGKPLSQQQTSRRRWPRGSDRANADREEVARLMIDELQQRGVIVGTASGVGHPE